MPLVAAHRDTPRTPARQVARSREAAGAMSMAGPSVPDVATLRAICHREKLARDRRPWYVASRRISIYLTWLLAHTGVTANQVTLFSVVLASTGGVLLAAPSAAFSLCGAAALLA